MEITVSPLNMEELPEALAVIRESYDTLLSPSMEPEGNRDFYRFACLEEMKKRFSSSLFLAAREGGRIVGMIFFICVLFAALSSILNLYEAPIAYMQERFGLKRLPAVLVIGLIGTAVSVLIQPWTSQWMDVVSIYICPAGALLAAIMFFWVLKKQTALDAVNEGAEKSVGKWFYPMGKYVFCLCALVALVAGALLGVAFACIARAAVKRMTARSRIEL